jgi:hypothetical protein
MLVTAQTPSEVLARVFPPAQSLPGADDRITCATCRNLVDRVCSAWREVGATRGYMPMDDLPRRCLVYRPGRDEQDQRSGRERWPTLETRIKNPKEQRK